MVKIKDNLRLQFQYLIQKLAKNGKVPLTIIRQGKTQSIELPVAHAVADADRTARGPLPVVLRLWPAGLLGGKPRVLSPLSTGPAAHWPRPWRSLAARWSPAAAIGRAFEGEELVVVTSPMFPHALGKGYDNPFSKVVKEVNGVKVKNLRHFVELLRDTKSKYTTIAFDDRFSETIVFDHQDASRPPTRSSPTTASASRPPTT